MHKKDVLDADQVPLNAMEQMHYTNSDFNVCVVIEHLSGKQSITVLRDVNTGSDYGLPRTVPSGYFANCLATVHQNSMALRIIGLDKPQRGILITQRSGM